MRALRVRIKYRKMQGEQSPYSQAYNQTIEAITDKKEAQPEGVKPLIKELSIRAAEPGISKAKEKTEPTTKPSTGPIEKAIPSTMSLESYIANTFFQNVRIPLSISSMYMPGYVSVIDICSNLY